MSIDFENSTENQIRALVANGNLNYPQDIDDAKYIIEQSRQMNALGLSREFSDKAIKNAVELFIYISRGGGASWWQRTKARTKFHLELLT